MVSVSVLAAALTQEVVNMRIMRHALAVMLAVGLTAALTAQQGTTQSPPTGQTGGNTVTGGTGTGGTAMPPSDSGAGDPTSGSPAANIGEVLVEEGLAAVLSDADMARELGLDFEQWLEAQQVIQEFNALTSLFLMFDPEGEDPNTLIMLNMIRFFLDWNLFFMLTPEQQDRVNELFTQASQGGDNGGGSVGNGNGSGGPGNGGPGNGGNGAGGPGNGTGSTPGNGAARSRSGG
jgi:hypothetical protein